MERTKIGTEEDKDWDRRGQRLGLHKPKIWTEADQDWVRSGRRLGLYGAAKDCNRSGPRLDWSSPISGQELAMIGTGAPQDWDRSGLGLGKEQTKIGTEPGQDCKLNSQRL
jgi:hypothetical protein